MNQFLSKDHIERIERLALGLEPIDAGSRRRIAHPIRVMFDEEARGLARPRVDRHDSCLHALLYQPSVAGGKRVKLRFVEQERRFVPRMISFPILNVVEAEAIDYRNRVRRPVLFPGAAYDIASGMTGLRGRVERAGKPMPWSRVQAALPGNGTVVGLAHGDDRGEFLLIISPLAGAVGDLVDPLLIRVDVFGPSAPPLPDPITLPNIDPFWDLPEEKAQVLNPADPDADPISAGETLPPGYSATTNRDVNLILGQIKSDPDAFNIP
jgi:hypothetical protein